MDTSKLRKEVKQGLTPTSYKNGISNFSRVKSPEKRLKKKKLLAHRPSLSSAKQVSNSLNFGSKSNTPKNSRLTNSINHKRFLSSGERPTSSSSSKQQLKTPSRKFSLDQTFLPTAVCKFSYMTCTGFIPGNNQKKNQDSFFIHINLANQPDMYLFGVCDGHGFYGGEASNFIKQRLPALIAQDAEILKNTKNALKNSILKCNAELVSLDLDVKFSGSTLNLVLIKGKTLFCANVGDSRALLARQLMDSSEKSMVGKR